MSSHLTGLTIFRRRINRFLCLGVLGLMNSPLGAADAALSATSGHEFQLNGAYSVANSMLKNTLAATYGIQSVDYAFTDYGAKFFWRGGKIEPGVSTGIYSSIATRATVNAGTSAGSSWPVAGTSTYATGDYRLGLAWVPLQFRSRVFLFHDWIFLEAGLGPAYGFGAVQHQATLQSGTVNTVETRYQKFSEWGWITSAALGFDFKLVSGLGLQVFVEGAHIYAKIRNPDLTQADSIVWSQFFVRPGLAVTLTF